MSRRPCLAEEWFVADTLRHLDGLCAACRASIERAVAHFGTSTEEALRATYRMSRSIRAGHVMSGRMDLASRTGDWAAVEVMWTIECFAGLSFGVYAASKPHLFEVQP